jgi:hypothetical protein
MTRSVDTVTAIIERSNQRGGRMLSMVDLVRAETFSLGQAAWLAERIAGGSSWLVGAKPGGAGKTAVVGALLGFLPADTKICLANPDTGWQSCRHGDCVVAYEISPGQYDAYIWGDDVRTLTDLGMRGVRIVTNLHADTLEEARAQVVVENGAAEEAFAAFGLFIPLHVSGLGWPRRREVHVIHSAAGRDWLPVTRAEAEAAADEGLCEFLEQCMHGGIHRVEDVRRKWLRLRRGENI